MCAVIFQMDPSQGLVLKSGMRVDQAQKPRPTELNSSGLTIRRTLELLPPSLYTRLVSISSEGVS